MEVPAEGTNKSIKSKQTNGVVREFDHFRNHVSSDGVELYTLDPNPAGKGKKSHGHGLNLKLKVRNRVDDIF